VAARAVELRPPLRRRPKAYGYDGAIAVNTLAESPHKTRFHELAHVVHGHCSEGLLSDDERTSRNIREVEAEGVAFILCTLLGVPGLDESRGYLQAWLGEGAIPERSAQRIYAVANKILAAGQAGEPEVAA
jgi:antirestriction protein ArdC